VQCNQLVVQPGEIARKREKYQRLATLLIESIDSSQFHQQP